MKSGNWAIAFAVEESICDKFVVRCEVGDGDGDGDGDGE